MAEHIRKKQRDLESRVGALLESVNALVAVLPANGHGESARQWLERFDAISKQLHILGDELGGGAHATILNHWVVHPVHPASTDGQPSPLVPNLLRTKLDLEQGLYCTHGMW